MIDFKPSNPNHPNHQGQKEARPGNNNPGHSQGGRTGAPGQGQGGKTGTGVGDSRHASDKSDNKSGHGVGAGKPGHAGNRH